MSLYTKSERQAYHSGNKAVAVELCQEHSHRWKCQPCVDGTTRTRAPVRIYRCLIYSLSKTHKIDTEVFYKRIDGPFSPFPRSSLHIPSAFSSCLVQTDIAAVEILAVFCGRKFRSPCFGRGKILRKNWSENFSLAPLPESGRLQTAGVHRPCLLAI